MGEPSGSGASSAAIPMVEADLGDESYGGAEGDDNGDFGAGDEFEGFDQYGDGAEFDDSLGAAGGSGAATDGKEKGQFFSNSYGHLRLQDSQGHIYQRAYLQKNGSAYWRCQFFRNRLKCPAKVLTYGQWIMRGSGLHNHSSSSLV